MIPNLQQAKRVTLFRAENGWIVTREKFLGTSDEQMFVFETTASLRDNLVELLGESKWAVSVPQKQNGPLPKRGPGGKFLPKTQRPTDATPEASIP